MWLALKGDLAFLLEQPAIREDLDRVLAEQHERIIREG
jgi:hypothetical protein